MRHSGSSFTVHLDAQQAPPAQFFKGALWNSSSVRKHEQDLDMMPPPESNLVPMSTRRSSINLPSTSELHSPPLNSMKQEYIDDNSQSSVSDSMDIRHERYRPISESSLDVNHDSNISMINENSIDMMHHNSVMSHISENSNLSINEDSMEMVRRNSISLCENASVNEENACSAIIHPIVSERVVLPSQSILTSMEKVMDLRMKLPMNSVVNDYVTPASSMAALKRFGIEPTNAPLPTQSAQSVENYLNKIESKHPAILASAVPTANISQNNCKSTKVDLNPAQSISNLLISAPAHNMGQSIFSTSQQPFLTEANSINSVAKSEAAALAEQTLSGATNASITSTTITTALEGSIPTTINTEKLDEILNSTLESHIGSPSKQRVSERHVTSNNPITTAQEVMLTTESSLLVPPVVNAQLASPVMMQQESQVSPRLSSEAIINSQISQNLMCRNTSAVQNEPLMASATLPPICQTTIAEETALLSTTIAATQTSLLPAVTTQDSVGLLSSEPEKAVLLEAAVDFLKTQKKICEELTTTAPDIMSITSASTDTSVLDMQNNKNNSFMPFSSIAPANDNSSMLISKTISPVSKPEYIPISVKDINTTSVQNDKKNEDRMIPQSFTSLTENELINLINPSCFDQV